MTKTVEQTQAGAEKLSSRLSPIAQLLLTDPPAAANAATEILVEFPGQRQALFLLVAALRLMKEEAAAQELLEWMAHERPKLASIRFELGILLARLSRHREAKVELLGAVEFEPNDAVVLRALGDQLSLTGDGAEAGKAYAQSLRLGLRELALLDEMLAQGDDKLANVESALRTSVHVNPTDVMARRMLANLCLRLDRPREAQMHLARVLELAPLLRDVRADYAHALALGARFREANEQYDILIDGDSPQRTQFECLKATNLIVLGDYDAAFDFFERMREAGTTDPVVLLNYGHALRTVRRSSEAVAAYRKCLETDPGFGAAWLALANLKTYRFSPAEMQLMQTQAARSDLEDSERYSLEFALGEAFESRAAYAESFEHYRSGNANYRRQIKHDTLLLNKRGKRAMAAFTPDLFRAKAGFGCPAPDPIFIVGLARAGSTLIEQILSSHSLVEGTAELHDLADVVGELQMRHLDAQYPALLSELGPDEFRALGERYLELSRRQRKLDRPFFTDKMGPNFLHAGFIHLILPNAKIIDARRHPLGCCFSGYKQMFPVGSNQHSYDLVEMAEYYRDYVELMAHVDRVLPGRVHRVFHEDMVRDPSREIRRLLAWCGLPYEEQCERFYQSDRAVRTVSSEQVRRPIDASAGEQWRNYEPWLGPAIEKLGDVLTLYPAVPEFE